MNKAVEAIVVLALIIFSFFVGVKYSDSVKSRASWLFETKEEEVELPDLSNESAVEENSAVEAGSEQNPAIAPAAVEAEPAQAAPAANEPAKQ